MFPQLKYFCSFLDFQNFSLKMFKFWLCLIGISALFSPVFLSENENLIDSSSHWNKLSVEESFLYKKYSEMKDDDEYSNELTTNKNRYSSRLTLDMRNSIILSIEKITLKCMISSINQNTQYSVYFFASTAEDILGHNRSK